MMIVDSAERNEFITDILTENDIPFEIKQLPVGDYVWNDYAIERKEINDFISSVSNNHIFDQLEDMIFNKDANCALVVHGRMDDIEWRYLKYMNVSTFYKHIAEIFVHFPTVSFFWVDDDDAFATLLSAMYHQSFSKKITHFNFIKKTKRNDINTLIATKHFSMNQAKLLLKKYSLRQIFNLSVTELSKYKGLGPIGMKKFEKFRGKK